MQPHEHLAIVLKQFEDIMHKPRDEVKSEAFYQKELESFLNSPVGILEAIAEQSDDFIKGLVRHPEILQACETYFHFMAIEKAKRFDTSLGQARKRELKNE